MEKNNEIIFEYNKKTEETMEQIMSLYETVHSLVNQNDKHNLINIIIEYSKKITRSDS